LQWRKEREGKAKRDFQKAAREGRVRDARVSWWDLKGENF